MIHTLLRATIVFMAGTASIPSVRPSEKPIFGGYGWCKYTQVEGDPKTVTMYVSQVFSHKEAIVLASGRFREALAADDFVEPKTGWSTDYDCYTFATEGEARNRRTKRIAEFRSGYPDGRVKNYQFNNWED